MSGHSPDPDPRKTPGLEPGGGVPPGETPPAESGTGTETGPRHKAKGGWSKGPTVVIGIVVVLCVAFFIAYAVIVAG
ncbi:hypothetical protein ADL22_23630 [Streptomyces sp. NRRL F-4489]|uniref:DUF6480 family protein n=1 Tax=Streptomyces sp. NRRL F-4489 TaxID=1609095 RepID=UPI00074AADA9|nr:DUF6480 family protein [Streptomyces sp. NRRL F-4489]KUL36887.1 hypothetical protein ADL22_23630 [Streptomyces sp. NRRL F-4489]